jgi:hypothetical protein
MRPKIRCDGKCEKIYKILGELNCAKVNYCTIFCDCDGPCHARLSALCIPYWARADTAPVLSSLALFSYQILP